MAKRTTTQIQLIDPKTIIELIMIKGEKVYSEEMEFQEAELIVKNKHPSRKKKEGWKYKIYQIGFSQYSNKIKYKE